MPFDNLVVVLIPGVLSVTCGSGNVKGVADEFDDRMEYPTKDKHNYHEEDILRRYHLFISTKSMMSIVMLILEYSWLPTTSTAHTRCGLMLKW